MASCEPQIVIIGGGIAGLSFAYHLNTPYHLYEKEQKVGGLCRSEELAGCIFDYAPKVLLLGDEYATELSCKLLGDNVQFHPFSDWSYHYRYGVFTRTPVQKHLYGLPAHIVIQALGGLVKAKLSRKRREVSSYRDWLYRSVGRPIADLVLLPQEHKKWKADPAEMDYRWASGRVPSPDLKTAIRGALRDIPHVRRFGYTYSGGIAALMENFAAHLTNVHLGVALKRIDTRDHLAYFNDGSVMPYAALVATLPLPLVVSMLDDAPGEVRTAAEGLQHLSLTCVSLVIERRSLSDKHFVYVHDPEIIFHRVSFVSNLSPMMAPAGYSTLQVEISHIGPQPLDDEMLIARTRADLIKVGFIEPDDRIVAGHVLPIPYAYPRQTPDRQDNVRRIRVYLEHCDIYPFGRFGEWEYYNMHDIIPRARDLARALELRYHQVGELERQYG